MYQCHFEFFRFFYFIFPWASDYKKLPKRIKSLTEKKTTSNFVQISTAIHKSIRSVYLFVCCALVNYKTKQITFRYIKTISIYSWWTQQQINPRIVKHKCWVRCFISRRKLSDIFLCHSVEQFNRIVQQNRINNKIFVHLSFCHFFGSICHNLFYIILKYSNILHFFFFTFFLYYLLRTKFYIFVWWSLFNMKVCVFFYKLILRSLWGIKYYSFFLKMNGEIRI